jgi:hypothetical protein
MKDISFISESSQEEKTSSKIQDFFSFDKMKNDFIKIIDGLLKTPERSFFNKEKIRQKQKTYFTFLENELKRDEYK